MSILEVLTRNTTGNLLSNTVDFGETRSKDSNLPESTPYSVCFSRLPLTSEIREKQNSDDSKCSNASTPNSLQSGTKTPTPQCPNSTRANTKPNSPSSKAHPKPSKNLTWNSRKPKRHLSTTHSKSSSRTRYSQTSPSPQSPCSPRSLYSCSSLYRQCLNLPILRTLPLPW